MSKTIFQNWPPRLLEVTYVEVSMNACIGFLKACLVISIIIPTLICDQFITFLSNSLFAPFHMTKRLNLSSEIWQESIV